MFEMPLDANGRDDSLAERVYRKLKEDIFELRLLPGDRFSEGKLATRMQASRTPVRQALQRLASEGWLAVRFRSGWQVLPFDFEQFEELYELRILLETAALRRLAERPQTAALAELETTWLVAEEARELDSRRLASLDEAFHCQLLEAAGNRELARVHREVTERIRIVRRLDFTEPPRIEATYREHAAILEALRDGNVDLACQLLSAHIWESRTAVRRITAQRLHAARDQGRSKDSPAACISS